MNKIIIDSSAWIEYFAGTDKGRKLKEFLGSNIFVTDIIVEEVLVAFQRKKLSTQEALSAIKSLALLVHSDFRIAFDAVSILSESKRIGMGDAHNISAARAIGGKLVTCDTHLSGISEAIIIK